MMALRRLIARNNVSAIVSQIGNPKTDKPEVEVPALVADLMYWWEEDRKNRKPDWRMVT